MLRFYKILLLFSGIVLFPITSQAQSQKTEHTLTLDQGQTSPKANIEDVAWIAGDWYGEAFGGQIEEIWRAPAGNAMMGMFRLIQKDQVGFYEMLIIKETDTSLSYILKHFNADLTGWEEKNETVSFNLVALEENIAFFDGITFQRMDDALTIYLASENKQGGFDELVFKYKLK